MNGNKNIQINVINKNMSYCQENYEDEINYIKELKIDVDKFYPSNQTMSINYSSSTESVDLDEPTNNDTMLSEATLTLNISSMESEEFSEEYNEPTLNFSPKVFTKIGDFLKKKEEIPSILYTKDGDRFIKNKYNQDVYYRDNASLWCDP